jgi:hypothetical protein
MATVMEAVLLTVPVPPFVEEIADVVLFFTPAVTVATVSEIVH